MNKISDNTRNGHKVVLELKMVDQDSSYLPMMYEDLPVEFKEELDDMASELLDPDRGHVAVIGSPQSGKSFLINQVVGNFDRYLNRLDKNAMHFIRIEEDDLDDIMSLPNRYGTYIDVVTEKLGCEEEEICFVTEDPEVASKIFSFSKRSRIIFEASRSTFMNIVHAENSGDTKMWASWRYFDVTEILIKKQDLINTLYLALNERVKETFNVDLTKKMIAMFVSHALRKLPELISKEGEFKGKITAPLGIWLVTLRRMGGFLGLSESESFHNKTGELVLGKVINNIFKDNQEILESYIEEDFNDEPENILIIAGPDGQPIKIPLSGLTGNPFENNEGTVSPDIATQSQENVCKKVVFNNIATLGDKLKEKVLGQDEAVKDIVDGLVVPAANLNDPTKPIRSMFFLGPTGVGKTKMAQTLAETIAEEPMNLVRVDMSEYSQPHEAAKLLGAPPGYVGFDKGGILTNAIIQNPCSVILLDEIEKAHPKIWDSFLQIFDAGRMTDGTGVEVDFTQTIIIMTSNIGSKESQKKNMGFVSDLDSTFEKKQEEAKRKTIQVLKNSDFRPELLNRIDETIVFNSISESTALDIVDKEIKVLSNRMAASGYTLDTVNSDILNEILVNSNITEYGARDIQRVILKNISNPVAYSMVTDKENSDKNFFSLFMDKNNKISVKRSLK